MRGQRRRRGERAREPMEEFVGEREESSCEALAQRKSDGTMNNCPAVRFSKCVSYTRFTKVNVIRRSKR